MMRYWTAPALIWLAFWETLLRFEQKDSGYFRQVRDERGRILDFKPGRPG